MARFYRRNKLNITNIIVCVLLAALCIGSVAVLGGAFGKNDKTTLDFSVGALDSKGKYTKSDSKLYTKESVECDLVTVTRDFESTTRYQIYFYDEHDNYVSCTPVHEASAEFVAPDGASRIRVVLIPTFTADDDKVVKSYEIFKYKNEFDFDITVIAENTDDLTEPAA